MVASLGKFKRISICDIAKEAWHILEVTHEETKIVKNSKLLLLTIKFDEIKEKAERAPMVLPKTPILSSSLFQPRLLLSSIDASSNGFEVYS